MKQFFIWSAHGTEQKGSSLTETNLIGSAVVGNNEEATGFAYRQFKSQEPGAGVKSIAVGELKMDRLAEFLESQIGDLAKDFSFILQKQLGKELLQAIVRNGRDPHSGACHTHDFCDANEYMAEAFEKVMGREVNLQSDYDTWLWGQAWGLAKRECFYVPKSEQYKTRKVPTPTLEGELARRGWKRSEEWYGEGNWFAAYHYKAKDWKEGDKKMPKFYLITAAAVTGKWMVEILASEKKFNLNDKEAEDETYEDPNESSR